MSARIIKNGKVYEYDADFDEIAKKWFGNVAVHQSRKIVHETESSDSYTEAITLAEKWIINKAK